MPKSDSNIFVPIPVSELAPEAERLQEGDSLGREVRVHHGRVRLLPHPSDETGHRRRRPQHVAPRTRRLHHREVLDMVDNPFSILVFDL